MVKRLYRDRDQMRLVPENGDHKKIVVSTRKSSFRVRGSSSYTLPANGDPLLSFGLTTPPHTNKSLLLHCSYVRNFT